MENEWSASEISKFSGWHISTVKKAIKELKLSRPRRAVYKNAKYGWKVRNNKLVLNQKEQKVIDKMKHLYEELGSFQKVADSLNKEGIATKNSKKWSKTVILQILRRERSDNLELMRPHS